MQPRLFLIFFAFFTWTQILCGSDAVIAETTARSWREIDESSFSGWKLLNRENRTMILKTQLDHSEFHPGDTSEKIQMVFPKKADIFLGCAVDFPWVIEELSPGVRIKSDRPGLALGAQIVLPHTINPKTGRPVSFLVPGSRYTDHGEWEELHFRDSQGRSRLHELAQRTAKNLRGEFGIKFDLSDMYVRQLVLYVEGLPGKDDRPVYHNLWIDDLQIDGHVPYWSTRGGIEKLEPEFTAFHFELENLKKEEKQFQESSFAEEKQETAKTNPQESTNSNPSDSPEGFPKVPSSPLRKIHRIEIIGADSRSDDSPDPVEKRKKAGFRPVFDPVNLRAFLISTISEPVYPKHSADFEGGSFVWESTVDIGRRFDHTPTRQDFERMRDEPGFSDLVSPYPAYTNSGELNGYAQRRLSTDQYHPGHVNPIDPFGTPGEQEYSPHGSIRPTGQILTYFNHRTQTETNINVRAIEYRGEPLQFLQSMGFNAIWISTPPTKALLDEVNQLGDNGIWLICPPPTTLGADNGSPLGTGTGTYDRTSPTPSIYRNVLAWNMGDHLVVSDVEEVKQQALKLRASDRNARQERPFLCSVDSGALELSRIQDMIVLTRREPLLSTLNLEDYGSWLRNYQSFALPSTPRWATVQTQPDQRLVSQWDLFGGHREQPIIVSFDQIRLLVREALASGSHGLLFTSQTPLTDDNPETQYRAQALALMNLELNLIREWFSEGTVERVVKSNHPQLSAAVLRINGAKLLLPLWNEPNSQYAFGYGAVSNATFLIPGIAETYEAKMLTPGGFERVQADRIAGGTQIQIEDASLNSIVVLCETGSFLGELEDRARKLGRNMSLLAKELAGKRLQSDEKTLLMLKQAGDSDSIPYWTNDHRYLVSIAEQDTLIKSTRREIGLCEDLFERGDYTHAYLQAERATRGLRNVERQMWVDAVRADVNRSMLPVSTCFSAIPFYISTFNSFREAEMRPNHLLFGDFECAVDAWLGVGWKLEIHQSERYQSDIGLKSQANFLGDHSRTGSPGKVCLRLSLQKLNPEGNTPPIETAPVWITTPAIPISSGELICVSGWIRIPQTIEGSVDGLMIRDSIGGDPLALRFRRTEDWQEFAFYRYAPSDGLFETKFLLSGIGEVFLDDISINPIILGTMSRPVPVPAEPQPVIPPPSRWGLERLNPFQYFPGRQP